MVTATPKNVLGTPVFVQFNEAILIGTVGSLLSNTIYTVRVEALDSSGNVLAQSEMEQLTAPDVPSIEQAYSKLSNSITVEWTTRTGATGYILRAQSGKSIIETTVGSSPGTLNNLKPASEYTITVMSVNTGGRSQPSKPKKAKTVLSAPNLTSSSPSNDTIVVSWSPVFMAEGCQLSIMRSDGLGSRLKTNASQSHVTFTELEAGITYSIKANAYDADYTLGDDATVSQITRPARPESVQVTLANSRAIGMEVSWSRVEGADNYTAYSTDGLNCTGVDVKCQIGPLQCGNNYSVSVLAYNRAGPSVASLPAYFLTDVTSIVEAVASNLTVSWSVMSFAENYTAFVKRDDGLENSCSTGLNICYFQIQCGFTYFISVFAYNKAGQSPLGNDFNYTTAPCCPENILPVFVSSDTLEITWSAVRGAEIYETKAGHDGHLLQCNDTATVCALTDLQCNARYTVVVTSCSEARGCNSSCLPHYVETAPCSPQIVNISKVNVSTFSISWISDNDAANYTVRIQAEEDTEAEVQTCRSTGRSCQFNDLPCGATFGVSAIAATSAGESLPSYTVPLETDPCCPQNLTVTQVTQSMTNVSWSEGTGAQSYVTVLESSRGKAQCHTLQTHCLLGCITCGTNYTVTLNSISESGLMTHCRYHGYSSRFAITSITSPAAAQLNVKWTAYPGATYYFLDLRVLNSNTIAPVAIMVPGTAITKLVQGLRAGSDYNVTVKATTGINYNVVASAWKLATTGIQTKYNCAGGFVLVTWQPSFGASSYKVSAVQQNGSTFTCTSETTRCLMYGLTCGKTLTVRVTATLNNCESNVNSVAVFETGPCAPSNLSFYRDCYSNAVIFSWNASLYAAYYSAIAVASNGTVVECRTVDTSCFFTNFTCGMGYVLTVSAYNSYCNSNRSASIRVQTAPCEPHNVKIRADCQMDMLVAQWDYAAGALSYTIEATSNNGQQYNCSSFMNSCVIPEVNCGESLNAWIIASDDECNNSKALSEVVETVPCSPSVIKADAGCTADSISVFWADTNGAVTYITTAEGSDGEHSFCTSSHNNCHLTDLPCGQSYNISVIASNSKCNSSRSNTVFAYTVPCGPEHIEADTDCLTGIVTVLWDASEGAHMYSAIAESVNGTQNVCNSTDTNCIMAGLECGQPYMISVRSSSGNCQSMPSKEVLIQQGGAMPPSESQESAHVSWELPHIELGPERWSFFLYSCSMGRGSVGPLQFH
ncbi:FNDC7 protein, partial [Polypterus senegalus]